MLKIHQSLQLWQAQQRYLLGEIDVQYKNIKYPSTKKSTRKNISDCLKYIITYKENIPQPKRAQEITLVID